jgi:hypothetical protein
LIQLKSKAKPEETLGGFMHDAFQGDLDQYFNTDYDLIYWRPVFSELPEPTPRTVQLETAMEAGFPARGDDNNARDL